MRNAKEILEDEESDKRGIERGLVAHAFHPNPSLDQHFIYDRKLIRRITGILEVEKDDVIFEIGAGIGTITKEIPKCKRIYAVEIDKKAFSVLKNEIGKSSYIEPMNADAIALLDAIPFTKIFSSTPFAICEPLLNKLFTLDYSGAVLLLPKKFVDSVLSKKTKLGLFSDAFLDIKVEFEIERESFYPIPRARTVVVSIIRKEQDSPSDALSGNERLENFLVRSFYLQRDKKLKNALREIFGKLFGLTKRQAEKRITALSISPITLEKLVESMNYNDYQNVIEKIKSVGN
ncbi:MAG: hypothetical protein NTV63_05525 [Candidatus Woesearchaeota archaeon]|nr:hypothetical protein [Candidatus Woesearchaeota archaeon]